VLSHLFRAKFVAYLKTAFRDGELGFYGELKSLGEKRNFVEWLTRVAGTEWVVYAKPPFGGPRQVLKYLARYTHRVAISNQRLVSLEDGQVTFRWKNYARASEPATMTLQAEEFIRRFLLHVLPKGFVKVRHFGFLANRFRRDNVLLCRQLLAASSTAPAGAHSARLGFKRTRSQHRRALSALQSWQHEIARNCRASSGHDCVLQFDFHEGSNGYVLTKTSRLSVFHSQLRQVESAVGRRLTAAAPVCLLQSDRIDD